MSAANPTNGSREADVAVFNQHRQVLGTRHFSLGPHASTVSLLDDLIGSSPNIMVGGIEITYAGEPESVLFSGGLEDDQAGYSAALLLSMASMPVPGANPPPASCTMAAAGLMLGAPDPMEGFPAGIHFSLFGFARNTGSAPLTVHALVNYMDKAGPHSVALPDVRLGAGEARDLTLNKFVHLPFRDGMANISFTYDAPCGPLLLGTGSVDATGSYVFEVNPQAVAKSGGRVLQFWQVGAGTDTMYSVWNPTARPEDLMVTIFFEPGGIYHYPLHLEPNASTMLSMLELVRKGLPDAEGHIIPVSTRIGSLKIAGTSPDIRDMVTFVVSVGIYNPVAGTCCPPYITCYGSTGGQMVLSAFTIAVNGTQSEQFYLTQGDGSQQNYSSSASWSSGSTSVLTVQSGGLATGFAPGSTNCGAMMANVPIYVAAFCGSNCPTGSQGASAPATVTPSITWNNTIISNTTQNAVVGEKISLSGNPGGGTWSISGVSVGGFQTGSVGGPLPVATSGTNVLFYWASVGSQTVTYSVSGSSVKATFTVVGPSGSMSASALSVNAILIDTSCGFLCAHYGPSGPSGGVHFVNNYSDPTGYTGSFEWVQTGSSTNSRTNATTKAVQTLSCTGELDTSYPYDTGNPTNDSPDTQLSAGYSDRKRSDTLTMTLMFEPALTGAIFVPVANVSWNWGFDATSSDGGNTWTFASRTPAGALAPSGTTTYPAWSGNLSTCHF